MCAAMRADTEAGIVRIMILFRRRHVALSISHPDRLGMLAAISTYMASEGLNMLQLRTEVITHRKKARTEVILTSSRGRQRMLDRGEEEGIAAGITECVPNGSRDISCDITWPK